MSLFKKTETFIADATWLTDEDQPMVELLLLTAMALDSNYSAATANTYGVSYRSLMKKKAGVVQADEDEEFLNSL